MATPNIDFPVDRHLRVLVDVAAYAPDFNDMTAEAKHTYLMGEARNKYNDQIANAYGDAWNEAPLSQRPLLFSAYPAYKHFFVADFDWRGDFDTNRGA